MMFVGYRLYGSTDFAKALSVKFETFLERDCWELWIHIINKIEIRHETFSTTLVADEAPAITNGFISAFGGIFEREMCWAHMIRKACPEYLIKKLDITLGNLNNFFEGTKVIFLAG